MKSLVAHGVAGVLLLVGVLAVSAQSLGDLARRAEERRETITTESKVYTNESLRPEDVPARPVTEPSQEPPRGESSVAPSIPADAEPVADPAAGSLEEESAAASLAEADWRQRIADVRQVQARARILADALQSRINVLAADFVNRDDPVQRDIVAADRQKALAELAHVTDEIEQHQQTLIDIQEEARRAGVPAGWVR